MLQETPPPRVTVANGNQLLTNFICPEFKWEMNKKRFQAQLRVLPLGSYDVVLGVDWLGSLGPVTFNYQELQLQFQSQGKTITLYGNQHTNRPSLKMMTGDSFAKEFQRQGHGVLILLHGVYPTSTPDTELVQGQAGGQSYGLEAHTSTPGLE